MECLLFLSQIHSPYSSVSHLTWKTEMRSSKATFGLLTKIPVEKLLWGMSTTRREEEEAKKRSSLRPSWQTESSLGQPQLVPCHRGQRTAPAEYEGHHTGIVLSKERHPSLCFQKINSNPKVDMGEVKEKFIMLKGENTACIWLEASTVLSITLVTVREQMTLMESQTGNGFAFFWTVCLWLWTDLRTHVKHKTSEQTNSQTPNRGGINDFKCLLH